MGSMPIVRISLGEEITEEETKELISELQSDSNVETVKRVTDRSIGAVEIAAIVIKVVSTSIPVIQKLHQTLKKRGKDMSLEFTLGDSNQKVSIKGKMSTDEVAALIKKVSG